MEQVIFNILSSDDLECKIMKKVPSNLKGRIHIPKPIQQLHQVNHIYIITSKTYDSSSKYLAPPLKIRKGIIL